MAVETLELRVVVSGGSQANTELQSIARSVNGMNDALRFMRSALVLMSFARVFSGLFEAVNQFQLMYNKLRLVTNSSQEAQAAQITLAKAAIETRASYEDTVNVFAALARSTKALNLDYGQLLTLTKEWNESIVVSGVDQQQARNALKDFIEELNLGVIQGRQLRALLMQNPEFLRLMAEGMAKVGKASDPWFEKIKEATAGGKTLSGASLFAINKMFPGSITSTEAVMAVLLGADEEAKKFNQTTITLGQAWTILKTKAEIFFATLTQKVGALDWLKQAMSWVGDHLDVISEAVAAFAGLLIINTVTGALTTFGGTAGSVFGLLFRSVTNLYSLFQRFFLLITSEEGILVLPLILLGATIYAVFHKQINDGAANFASKVQAMGGWVEYLIRFFSVFAAIIQTTFGNLGAVIGNTFVVLANGIIAAFQFAINKFIEGVNWLSSKINTALPKGLQLGQIGNVDFGRVDNPYARTLQNAFNQNVTGDYKALEGAKKQVEGFFSQFNLNNMKGGLNLGGRPAGAGTETTVDETKDKIDKAREALKGFLDQFAGSWGQYLKQWDDFNDKLSKVPGGLKDAEIAAQMAQLGFKDLKDVQIAMIDKLLGTNKAAKDYADAQKLVNVAVAAGSKESAEYTDILLTKQIAALEANRDVASGVQAAMLKLKQTQMDQAKEAESVVTDALKGQEALVKLQIGYQALKQAADAGSISQDKFNEKLRDLQIEALKANTDMASGFARGMLEIQKSMDDVGSTAAEALKNSFKSLEDTLVEFFDTGKLNVKKFADDVLAQFTRLAVQSAIMQPLANLLFGGATTPGQPNSGSGILGSLTSQLFGGLTGTGQLGSSATTPMWVQVAGVGGLVGAFPGAGGSSSTGGLGGLFDSGGLFGSGGFFSNLFNGGGGAGSASSGILGALGDIGSFFGFAEGGSFMVGGSPGNDANLVAFRASADERVSIQTPAQQRAASRDANKGKSQGDLHLHLHGVNDVDSFRRSKSQVAAGMGILAEHNRRRNYG